LCAQRVDAKSAKEFDSNWTIGIIMKHPRRCAPTAKLALSLDKYMTNKAVVLNNVEHKDLKVDARQRASYGDNVNRTLAFPTEFGELHKEYPILFHKDPETSALHAHAILGFDLERSITQKLISQQ
jgi:hypothetical protein